MKLKHLYDRILDNISSVGGVSRKYLDGKQKRRTMNHGLLSKILSTLPKVWRRGNRREEYRTLYGSPSADDAPMYVMDEHGNIEEIPMYASFIGVDKALGSDETVYRVDRHLPWNWWLYPSFNMELNLPFPYIWFGYWMMVWEWDDYQAPLWERKIESFHGISFMPD